MFGGFVGWNLFVSTLVGTVQFWNGGLTIQRLTLVYIFIIIIVSFKSRVIQSKLVIIVLNLINLL